jgi:predicted nucleic acid-binding protein
VRTAIATTAAVIDASVVVRGLVGSDHAAERTRQLAHGRIPAAAPDLLYAEIVNALVQYVRAGRLSAEEVGAALEYVADLPIESTACEELAVDALAIALDRNVSGYNAMYLALAEARDTVLITADRRLAAAAEHAELLVD